MLFSSLTFLFVFLPLLIFIYYISLKKYRNYILIFFSLIFYAWGGFSYTIILITSIIVNFLFVEYLKKSQNHKKIILKIGLTFNIIVIIIFKYLDFFIENINEIGILKFINFNEIQKKNIVLPLGISFFTFQQMSLLWDVYRDKKTKKSNLLDISLYISLFPQLIAGPIVRYNDIINQIKNRIETLELFRSGVQKFIIGLFKKIIFANTFGSVADAIMDSQIENISTPVAWLGIISYSFQIYFDFSGYSDMAIGLGRMFGFRILENFNFPYISKSITEFWRRWHISLSSWFRDYVYIPLGGNRNGIYRTYFNLFAVFLLTGFWHGATWSFIFWGLFHGIFITTEKIGLNKILNKVPKIFSWIYTMLVVIIGWVMFRIEILQNAFDYIKKMFGFGISTNDNFFSYINKELIIIMILATISSTTFFEKINLKLIKNSLANTNIYKIIINFIFIFMFLYSIIYINSGSYNPFIYFRF
ncbi:MAG: hypothetical protein B6I24_01760 [Bacteroidetes bacterium 4572_128]|nr:MAG: hypothetical protein B6I24_01760 [Bacteroidetes bacterium 4572_128]